jgi:hypothetical protein
MDSFHLPARRSDKIISKHANTAFKILKISAIILKISVIIKCSKNIADLRHVNLWFPTRLQPSVCKVLKTIYK